MVALFVENREPKIIWTSGKDPYPPIEFNPLLRRVRPTPA